MMDRWVNKMENISDLQVGKAGEYLVCADLIIKGYIAFPSEQGLHFDVVMFDGDHLYKIQVKTTRKPMPVPQRVERTDKYMFQVRRCGKGGRHSYGESDVDIFALVALDTRSIGYLRASEAKQTMFFLPDNVIPMKDVSDKKNEIVSLRNEGKTYTEISNILGVDRAYSHRVVVGKENKSFSRSYLSDLRIESCLK